MGRLNGIVEGLILVALGAGVSSFALTDNYGLLMSEKFRWVTLTGAVLMALFGVTVLRRPQRRPGVNNLFFAVFLLLVVVCKPYAPRGDSTATMPAPLGEEFWEGVDLELFPRQDMLDIAMLKSDDIFEEGKSFTTVGVVMRLEKLDEHGSFALMPRSPFMFCCIADAVSTGVRVPYDDFAGLENGQILMISGKLVREQQDLEIPFFRLGYSMLSTVNKDYYILPDEIRPYSPESQLPLLTAQLESNAPASFLKAMKESGAWEKLESKEPLTVFIPVEMALDELDGAPLDQYPAEELEEYISAHVVKGKLSTKELLDLEELEVLSGQTIKVTNENANVRVGEGGSRIVFKNIKAQNAMVHLIYPALKYK